jgi:hypothetical protein
MIVVVQLLAGSCCHVAGDTCFTIETQHVGAQACASTSPFSIWVQQRQADKHCSSTKVRRIAMGDSRLATTVVAEDLHAVN